ncbi:hypothetical protein FGADI_13425 [Fusarium gaditjirri]|uniref:non-specific serine/threonine protein kinase n=1 Tax=Fusarium gaditjirri TaxID=282569 RepID=A0A8H4SPX2_9HYPO|nr:hypothetical protein FGADI_13425 [Fusarium gaditjirri]
MDTGAHYACKVVNIAAELAQSQKQSETEFRIRVRKEIHMVQKLKHPHIVPYTYTQEPKTSHDIQIFMPVYEGNLLNLLQEARDKGREARDKGQEAVLAITSKMLFQMLQALAFVHTHDPPIIHRDVKPLNILHRGGNFFLTDFGIAKMGTWSWDEHTSPVLIEWTTAAPEALKPYLATVQERIPTDENRPEETRTLVIDHLFNDGGRHALIYRCVEQPIDLRDVLTRIEKPSPEYRRALGSTIATQVRSLYVHFRIHHPALRTESFVFFVGPHKPDFTKPYILDWGRQATPEMYQHPEYQEGKPLWFYQVWSLMMVLSEIAEWKPLDRAFRDDAELRSRKLERKRLVTSPGWKGAVTAEIFQYGFGFLEKDRNTLEEYSEWEVKRFFDRLCKLLEPL